MSVAAFAQALRVIGSGRGGKPRDELLSAVLRSSPMSAGARARADARTRSRRRPASSRPTRAERTRRFQAPPCRRCEAGPASGRRVELAHRPDLDAAGAHRRDARRQRHRLVEVGSRRTDRTRRAAPWSPRTDRRSWSGCRRAGRSVVAVCTGCSASAATTRPSARRRSLAARHSLSRNRVQLVVFEIDQAEVLHRSSLERDHWTGRTAPDRIDITAADRAAGRARNRALGLLAGQRERPLVRSARVGVAAEAAADVGARGMGEVIVLQLAAARSVSISGRPAAGPSRIATATARLSATTGDGCGRTRTS